MGMEAFYSTGELKMILSLIINILAVIGALTLALIALALWAYVSDEEFHELEGLTYSIPTLKEESQN